MFLFGSTIVSVFYAKYSSPDYMLKDVSITPSLPYLSGASAFFFFFATDDKYSIYWLFGGNIGKNSLAYTRWQSLFAKMETAINRMIYVRLHAYSYLLND